MNKKITFIALSVLLCMSACHKAPVVDVANEEVKQDVTNPDAQKMPDSMQKEASDASPNDESEAQRPRRQPLPLITPKQTAHPIYE